MEKGSDEQPFLYVLSIDPGGGEENENFGKEKQEGSSERKRR